MFTLKRSFYFCSTILSPYLSNNRRRSCRKLRPKLFARKQNSIENPKTKQHSILSLRVPNAFLARSTVAILGLGFIDAGYSGDWSRIGVISKDAEGLLKIAAYVVVPLCFFLMFSISNQEQDED